MMAPALSMGLCGLFVRSRQISLKFLHRGKAYIDLVKDPEQSKVDRTPLNFPERA